MMSGEAPAQQRYIPPSRRRDKPILSCNLCRRRKLKCDRQQPCKGCVDRGLSLSCTYSRNQHISSTPSESKAANNVHDRIDQLEKLVTTLIEQKRSGNSYTPSTVIPSVSAYSPKPSDRAADVDAPLAPDRVKLEADETSYTNSGHWTSILDGIAELKEHLDSIPTTVQPGSQEDDALRPDLLFSQHRHATREEILVALPSRAEADQMIDKYFTYMDMSQVLLHRPTFLRHYEKFWEKPEETPIMWIGLLYCILATATHFISMQNEYNHNIQVASQMIVSTARIDFYREKVVQSLILANYPKCPPYTLETMISYSMTEYMRRGPQFGSWLLSGMLIRIAFRMGYHRDPSRFPNISPFTAEMRRRMWTMIVQMDLLSSVQVGLPMMIQPSIPDVMEPRNLTEDDLHENMTELPPSREDTKTPLMYMVCRNRLLRIFARVQERANASEPLGYRESLELDTALRSTYEGLPASLKGYMTTEFDVESDVAMRQLFLALTFLKCIIMIHRPFLLLGREDPRYEYSRTCCLDAALEILDFQSLLEAESRTGFERWSITWKLWAGSWRLSSLVNHDFFLATTVLLLDVNKDIVSPLQESNGPFPRQRFQSGHPSRAELIATLLNSYNVWQLASLRSREAARVAAAVKLVLSKADSTNILSTAALKSPSQQDGLTLLAAQQGQVPNAPMNTAASNNFFDFNDPDTSLPFPMSDTTMDFGGDFDWGGFESQYPLPTFEQHLQTSYFG